MDDQYNAAKKWVSSKEHVSLAGVEIEALKMARVSDEVRHRLQLEMINDMARAAAQIIDVIARIQTHVFDEGVQIAARRAFFSLYSERLDLANRNYVRVRQRYGLPDDGPSADFVARYDSVSKAMIVYLRDERIEPLREILRDETDGEFVALMATVNLGGREPDPVLERIRGRVASSPLWINGRGKRRSWPKLLAVLERDWRLNPGREADGERSALNSDARFYRGTTPANRLKEVMRDVN